MMLDTKPVISVLCGLLTLGGLSVWGPQPEHDAELPAIAVAVAPEPVKPVPAPVTPPAPTPAPAPAPAPKPIIIPVVPIDLHVPQLPPIEQPIPPPSTPIPLPPNVLYVIDTAKVESTYLALASPDGLVTMATETGPIRIRAVFVDSPGGKPQTRTFTGNITIVEAKEQGRCELLVIPGGAKSAKDVVRRTLDVGGFVPTPPTPPVPPTPPLPPVPPPTPAPILTEGFRVLMVYETDAKGNMPAAQRGIILDKGIRDYLDAHCVKNGATPEYRLWDQNVDVSNTQKLWQDAFKRPRASVPWLIVSNGRTGYEGPLPATVAETMTLLRKYGGD